MGASAYNIVLLAVVDALSLLVSGIAIWKCCRVSLWQIFLYIQAEYSWCFVVTQACLLDAIFCKLMIACGIDQTFRFSWVWCDRPKGTMNATILQQVFLLLEFSCLVFDVGLPPASPRARCRTEVRTP